MEQDQFKQIAAGLKAKQIAYLIEKLNSGKDLTVTEQKRLNQYIDEADGMNGTADVSGGRFDTAAAVAKHYGITRATVSLHVKNGRISPNPDGTFEKTNTDAYFCGKLGRTPKPIFGNGKATEEDGKAEDPAEESIQSKIDSAKLRKIKAEAESKELLAAQMRGAMVSREEVFRIWGGRYTMFRDAILYMSKRLPPILVNRTQSEIEEILRDEAESIMKAFAKNGKFTPKSAIKQ